MTKLGRGRFCGKVRWLGKPKPEAFRAAEDMVRQAEGRFMPNGHPHVEKTALVAIASLRGKLHVQVMDAYLDGTVWASIKDEEGQTTQVCIDGRKNSPTRHRLFEKCRHPTKEAAVLIELGAPEEGVVVPLLSRWLDSKEASEWLTAYGKAVVQDALLRLGEPPGLTQHTCA